MEDEMWGMSCGHKLEGAVMETVILTIWAIFSIWYLWTIFTGKETSRFVAWLGNGIAGCFIINIFCFSFRMLTRFLFG